MPHPLPPALPTPAYPARGNPAAWFDSDSYPAPALRRSAEGRVVARLEVDAAGRVTGCTVQISSGDVDLDRATCGVAMRKGLLSPARSTAGAPIPTTFPLAVRWVLPRDDAGPPAVRSSTAAASASPPRRHHDWFERLLAAHHLLGLATALLAILAGKARRWLRGADYAEAYPWRDGDDFLAGSRRRLDGRLARLARVTVPVVLLALLLAWLDW